MKPAAPNRAMGKYSLQFGLMVIPVKMYAGSEDSGVKRSLRNQDGDPLGYATLRKTPEGYDLSRTYEKSEIVHVIATDRGEIPLTDDDILRATDQVRGDGEKVMEIVCTQPLDMLHDGLYITENLYQLRGDKTAVKPFATILHAMHDAGVFALVKFPTKAFVRYGALLPDGRLFTLRYDEEVRENADLPMETLGEAVEAQARELIISVLDTEPRELVDEVSNAIREYAEKKAEGMPMPEAAPAEPAQTADAFLAALSATVEGLKGQPKGKRPTASSVRATAKREKVSR